MNRQINPLPKKEVAWCKNHPTGYLGKDQFGHWYSQCWTGKKHNEKCQIIVEEGVRKYE